MRCQETVKNFEKLSEKAGLEALKSSPFFGGKGWIFRAFGIATGASFRVGKG